MHNKKITILFWKIILIRNMKKIKKRKYKRTKNKIRKTNIN